MTNAENDVIFAKKILDWLSKMKSKQDIAYFLAFCMEQYKHAKGLSGQEVLALFDQYGVLEYLSNHFEVLHTQGVQWIIEDIEEFIKIRKEKEVVAQ